MISLGLCVSSKPCLKIGSVQFYAHYQSPLLLALARLQPTPRTSALMSTLLPPACQPGEAASSSALRVHLSNANHTNWPARLAILRLALSSEYEHTNTNLLLHSPEASNMQTSATKAGSSEWIS
jgi:hypothetical protein